MFYTIYMHYLWILKEIIETNKKEVKTHRLKMAPLYSLALILSILLLMTVIM